MNITENRGNNPNILAEGIRQLIEQIFDPENHKTNSIEDGIDNFIRKHDHILPQNKAEECRKNIQNIKERVNDLFNPIHPSKITV